VEISQTIVTIIDPSRLPILQMSFIFFLY